MNEQGVQTESPADQGSKSSLAEPHFDDLAIAIAQPVEPLGEEQRGFGAAFRRHISTKALLIILAAAVGFASVTFGLAGVQRLTAEDQAAITAPEESAPVKIVDITKSDRGKDLSLRPAVRRTRVIGSQSKSEPRLVGVIR